MLVSISNHSPSSRSQYTLFNIEILNIINRPSQASREIDIRPTPTSRNHSNHIGRQVIHIPIFWSGHLIPLCLSLTQAYCQSLCHCSVRIHTSQCFTHRRDFASVGCHTENARPHTDNSLTCQSFVCVFRSVLSAHRCLCLQRRVS